MIGCSLITLCFLNLFLFYSHSYRTKVFNSAVFSFLPNFKLHATTTLKKEGRLHKYKLLKESIDLSNELNDLYIIDYTPKQQPDAFGYIKMFLGYKLPGIVRVIYIEKTSEENLIEDWNKLVIENPDYDKNLKKIGDKRVNTIIEKWKTPFNVYSHNCRHFSKYFIKEVEKL
jgi:hypothetical protein